MRTSVWVCETDFGTVELGDRLANVFQRADRLRREPWWARIFHTAKQKRWRTEAENLERQLQRQSHKSWQARRSLCFADVDSAGDLTFTDEVSAQ